MNETDARPKCASFLIFGSGFEPLESVLATSILCDVRMTLFGSTGELGQLKHLMIGDTGHQLSAAYDVLDSGKGIAYRGVYLIDPTGVLRWLAVHDLGVGRNVDEVLRVLDALQTDKLCPCNWKPGQQTLN